MNASRIKAAFGRKSRILLATLAALALVIVLFDWNWLRPAIEHYVSSKSHREVRAGHLAITGILSLEPTVTLREAYVQNAPWADSAHPMAVAGEVSFTFSIRSVIDRRPVISKIVLKDADVDMEKQADGLLNWRLTNPDDRGPPTIKVLSLEAHRSKLRIADRGREFDLRFTAADAGPGSANSRSAKPLATSVYVQGVYRGAEFTAQVLTSAVLTFRDTQEFFAVRGHAIAGNTRLDLDGEAADMLVQPMLNALVRAAGATLSQLHPFVLVHPAHSRPYDFEAEVRRTETGYRFEKLRGKIGETDLAGDAAHELQGERHHWRANLVSQSADLLDLASLIGTDYPEKPGPPDARLFPRRPIRSDRLRAQDLQLRLEAKKFKARFMPSLESLRLEADLHDGILQARSVDLGIAGGHAVGQFTLDTAKDVPHARLDMKVSGVRLARLLPGAPEQARRAGPLRGAIALEGSGISTAAILGAASGKVDLAIDGGSISNRFDAKLSLNLGKLAGLTFTGDHDIPIYCAVAGFDFHGGKGRVRAFLVETGQTRIEGTGGLNLRDETPDLVLVPHPKHPGLLTLGATIRVGGSLKHPAFQLHEGGGAAPASLTNAHCAGSPVTLAAAH